jgi:hypothetical protein
MSAEELIETPEGQRDGRGYIDEAVAEPCGSNSDADDTDGGSSIVESLDSDNDLRPEHGGWPESADEDDEDHLEWGVEDEDWELADGGA